MDKALLSKIRASFDFEVVPGHLFSEKTREFIEQVAVTKGEFLAELMNIYYMSCIKELGLSAEEFNQFTKDDFKVYNCAVGEEIVLVLVELSIDEGDEITCGYYVFADDRLENMVRFFTIENEYGTPVMGEVTPEKHFVYGEIPLDLEVIARTACNLLYKNREEN